MNYLGWLDYGVMAFYFVVIAAIGLYVSRRQKSVEDYFIARRRIPVWAVAFTLMATMISSTSYVAHPGAVFGKDLYLLAAHIVVPIVLIFVVLYIIPFYRHHVRMSAYEYLDQRFGRVSRIYASFGFVALRLLDLGFTIYTTAIAASVMSGWPILWIIIVLGIFTTLYTMIGGIEGVIWTDVVQGVVLVVGAVLILGILLLLPEGGASHVIETARAGGKFGLGNPELSWDSLKFSTPTIYIFFFAGLLSFGRSYICEQNMVQRYLVAKTDREAQRAAFFGALVCLPIWIVFMLIGAGLWAFYQITGATLPPEVTAKPDNILPYFIATQLPAGIVGLLLASILAAAQSTISADLNSVSTVLTNDYFNKIFHSVSERSQLLFGRSMVLVGGMAFTVVGVLLTHTRAVAALEVGTTLVSIVAGGILGLFALGFLTRRANDAGATVGILVCAVFTGWATITGPLHETLGLTTQLRFTWHPITIGIMSHFVLFGVGYAASFVVGGSELAPLSMTIRGGSRKARSKIVKTREEGKPLQPNSTLVSDQR